MKTIELKLYKFDELSEEAKKKAIEKEQSSEFLLDYPWYDSIEEMAKEDLEAIGLKFKHLSFTLYTQGQHATLEGLYIDDLQKFIETQKLACPLMVSFQERCAEDLLGSVETKEEIDQAQDEINLIDEALETFKKDKEKETLKTLYADYEYLSGDECIAENLSANDYDFEEDGSIY